MKLDRLSVNSAPMSQLLPVCRSVSTLLIRALLHGDVRYVQRSHAYRRVGGAVYVNY